MMDTFGDIVFRMSNNHQLRRGDPVRRKDFAAIEAQREQLGMSDAQIAARIGLSGEQVTAIRNLAERRRFRRHHFHRLNELGGGKRYRHERFKSKEDVDTLSESAIKLREAMAFRPELAARYVSEGCWSGDTLKAWVERHANERPDAMALACGADCLSWATLHRQVERRAAGLYELGIRRGDVVAVQLPNSIDFVVTYLAICRLGAVMTTLYLPHRETEMRTLLRFSAARAVVLCTSLAEFSPAATALRLTTEIASLEHVIVVGDALEGAHGLASVDADPAVIPTECVPAGADPFLLLFTSGTTAAPKAVPLSYQNMLSNARLSAPEHGIVPDDRILSAAPFGHLYALYSLHLALYAGATTVLLPVFSPPALAAVLERERPSAVFAAPAHMAACLGAGLLSETSMQIVRLLVMSGSAVPAELARGLHALMGRGDVSQLWGMTETQAGLYTRPGDAIELVANSAGRPSPGTEVRIVDAQGTELATGLEGELQVRGSLLFPGYLDNDAANAESFTAQGWFRSGDLATMDSAGNVAITGRVKDVINRGGVKYNPRDVEELLEQHPQVVQAAVVPIADPVLGERACCFIVAAGGAAPSLEVLCSYLLERGISKVKLPERLETVDAMPMTPTRKVIKGRLRPA